MVDFLLDSGYYGSILIQWLNLNWIISNFIVGNVSQFNYTIGILIWLFKMNIRCNAY